MRFTVSGGRCRREKIDAFTDTHTTPLAEICTEHLKTNKEDHHHVPVYENEAHASESSSRASDTERTWKIFKQYFTNSHEVW
jgi:hypothetical protein